ncbi:MAG: isochorismatase family protein [Acidimicrobiales bacterium]
MSAAAGHVADTEPYAWPYDGRLAGEHLALVVAGWDEAWRRRSIEPAAVAAAVAALAAAVARVGGLVVGVHHGDAAPLDLADGRTVGAAGIDAFWGGPIDATLRSAGRTHLLVVGHGLEGPVHSTLRSANDRGYECLLVTDACAPLTDDLADAAALTVTMSGGIFGAIGRLEPVLDALATLPTAPAPTHPEP